MNRLLLQAATANIDQEKSDLYEGRSAFETFRAIIRLIYPNQDGDSSQSKTTDKLHEAAEK